MRFYAKRGRVTVGVGLLGSHLWEPLLAAGDEILCATQTGP
jgi:hypothetical protein